MVVPAAAHGEEGPGAGRAGAGRGLLAGRPPSAIILSPRPQLKPILSEIEYLQDQHLLLTVKSLDGYESYGECPREGARGGSWVGVTRGYRPPTPPHPGCRPQGSASSP